jgi:hypothetical protein
MKKFEGDLLAAPDDVFLTEALKLCEKHPSGGQRFWKHGRTESGEGNLDGRRAIWF